LGFEQPSNAFFAIAIFSLAFLGILLSIEATSATDRLERASSSIAISRSDNFSSQLKSPEYLLNSNDGDNKND
jgi:hypothetical protein